VATRAAEVNPEGKKKRRNVDVLLVLMDFVLSEMLGSISKVNRQKHYITITLHKGQIFQATVPRQSAQYDQYAFIQ